jgi:hypothetical protein
MPTLTTEWKKFITQLTDFTDDELNDEQLALLDFVNSAFELQSAISDIQQTNLENKITELESIEELTNKEIEAEQKKIEELQTLAETQNGIEKQRTENTIRELNNRLNGEKNALQLNILAQEEAEAKLKAIRKREIYTQFVIDNASAISSIIKNAFTNPLNAVNPLVATLQLGAQLLQLGTAFAVAKNSVKQLRKGGKLVGATHEQGGIPLYEAEGGEFVINRKSTATYENTLNAINKQSDLQAIQRALTLDFGQGILKKHNINVGFDSQELKNELIKNNKNLEKLINITENKGDTVAINNEIITISKNSIRKLKI